MVGIVGGLTIAFAALSLVDPKSSRIRYRLEGHDNDWQEAVDRRFYRRRYDRPVELIASICIALSYLGWVSAQIAALGLVRKRGRLRPPAERSRSWWIAPVIESLNATPLFFGSVILTAFNDNAAITYLAYPNNPTGTLFDTEAIVDILRAVGDNGIVDLKQNMDQKLEQAGQRELAGPEPAMSNAVQAVESGLRGLFEVRCDLFLGLAVAGFAHVDRHAGDAESPLADRRLALHLLADRDGALEQRVEHRARRPELARRVVGVAHLPEDLRLADHHRIQR